MDTNWLEDYICLARTLNFTRAAQERNITQSAFSRRIKSLELWAGVPLIDRSTYPVRLSEAGEELLPVAKAMLVQLLRTRNDLRLRSPQGVKFHGFAAPHSISINHLARYLRLLDSAVPGIRTQVMSHDLYTCCELVSEGVCDFLLCYRHPQIPLTLDMQRFSSVDLGGERLIPVCVAGRNGGPRWRLPGRSGVTLPHLAYAKGSFLGAIVDNLLQDRPSRLEVTHMDAFAEALKSLALQGCGIAWLPESSAHRAIEAGSLVLAGGKSWHVEVTLSAFTETARHDEAGALIWAYFCNQAAAGAG